MREIRIQIQTRKYCFLLYKLLFSVLLFLNIFIFAGAVTNAHDEVFIAVFPSAMRFVLPVLLAAIICMFTIILYHYFERFSYKQLKISVGIMFGIMMVIFIVILCNFRSVPYSDALNVQDMALYFVKTGDRPISLKISRAIYFGRYGNNYFLTIVFVYLFKVFNKIGIQDIYTALQILTAAGIMTAALFMYLICVKIGGIRRGAKILALCVMNPLYYILALWVYTNVISIPFTMAVIYFGICIYQEKRRKYLVVYCILEAIVSTVGYFIRPTVVIPLIALVICAALWGSTGKKKICKLLQCSAICIFIGGLLFFSISKLNESYFSSVSHMNYPVTHWLMMGSHGDSMHNIADVNYTKSYKSKEEKVRATTKRTIENYKNQGIAGTISMFYNKLIYSWGHGDGTEVIQKASQDTRQTKLYSWVLGNRADLFRLYCHAFRIANVFMIIAALGWLLTKNEMDKYQFLFALSYFGGILFYCLWEVKGSYTAPFVYIMLLIGMQGVSGFADKIHEADVRLRKHRYLVLISVLPVLLTVCIISYYGMTNTVITHQDWSVCCSGGGSVRAITAKKEVTELSQDFYIEKPVNRIAFRGKADSDAKETGVTYQMKLLNKDKQEVYSQEIHTGDITSKGMIQLRFREIRPEGREKYTLQLRKKNDSRGKIVFQQRSNEYIDTYDGTLTVNGKKRVNDLYLQVYKEFDEKWCSKRAAGIINGGIFIMGAFMLLWFWNRVNTGKSEGEGKRV